MKFIPLFGEDAKDRKYIGPKWNRKYIRAIQSVLNVTKGIVAPGRSFFEKAFGKDIDEFHELLYMPETYIVYRYFFEGLGYTKEWRKLFRSLTEKQKALVYPMIESNNFKDFHKLTNNKKILSLLRHYTVRREDVKEVKKKDLDSSEQRNTLIN